MSNVEFEADNMGFNRSGSRGNSQSQSGGSGVGMVRWLVRHGIIASDGGAKAILIAFIAVNFIATFLILYFYVFQ